MDIKTEWRPLFWIIAIFSICFYLPVELPRVQGAVLEALHLAKWYAREHVLLCLVPAFFIAGAVAVFVSQAAVMKYLGPNARKILAYGVAAISGTILAVCSCTILPLFAGIYRMGAGLGPACAFLYSGPAINILAMVLTARILGPEMGIARAVGAVIFAVVIGLLMHFFFRHEEAEKAAAAPVMMDDSDGRPLWQTALYFAAMVGILVFANWGKTDQPSGLWHAIYVSKWYIASGCSIALALMLATWFQLGFLRILLTAIPAVLMAIIQPQHPELAFTFGVIGLSMLSNLKSTRDGEMGQWFEESWDFAKKILPLLLIGVLIAGVLLGRPGEEGLIPSSWINSLVGGNSVGANLFASVFGAFMYFATLTEVPILQGLLGAGMGKGPALALLLAGPALSLPNMLVIRSVMGSKKTVVFVLLVVTMATISGLLYGAIF
ncbi:permease [Malonomonas rubra]|uniref:permease n=1 Tax=Malonomonas rubra TaxID=57040 RepID=UPI0026F1D7B9|nr:permease [Malonomonas rubra]